MEELDIYAWPVFHALSVWDETLKSSVKWVWTTPLKDGVNVVDVKCVCLVNRFLLASLAPKNANKEEFLHANISFQSLRNKTSCIPIILGARDRNVRLFIFVLGFKTKLLSLFYFDLQGSILLGVVILRRICATGKIWLMINLTGKDTLEILLP